MASPSEYQHLVLHYLAVLLLIAGLFLPTWTVRRDDSLLGFGFAWRRCADAPCVSYSDKSWKNQAMIVGLFLSIFCAVVMTVHFALRHNKTTVVKLLPQISFCAALIGAALVLLVCAIYGFDTLGRSLLPGFSYFLIVVGGILLLVAGSTSVSK